MTVPLFTLCLLAILSYANITVIYSSLCKSSTNIVNQVRYASAEFNITVIDIDIIKNHLTNTTIPQIILENNQMQQLKYDMDMFDLRYWIQLYYFNKVELISDISIDNDKYENLLILHKLEYQKYLDIALKYPLYYLRKGNDTYIQQYFFIQNDNPHIIIRRKQDKYDYSQEIKNTDNLDQQLESFMRDKGLPWTQQYFTQKTIKFAQINQVKIALLIAPTMYQFKNQIYQFNRFSLRYRLQASNQKCIFIQTTQFLAKKLAQRFLYLKLKHAPHLVVLQFQPFRFVRFQENFDHVYSWLQNTISLVQLPLTYNNYLNQIPYLQLSYQNSTLSKTPLYNYLQIPCSLNLPMIRLVPNCIESFKLFAYYQQQKQVVSYYINEIDYENVCQRS